MNRKLYILTGASRGMGQAIAQLLLQPGHQLLCISRKTDPALAARAQAAGLSCEQWAQDLADGAAGADRLQAWLMQQDPAALELAALINNAGVMADIAPVDQGSPEALVRAMRVDLETPMLLTAAFLRASRDWSASRRVLNISSGLSQRAMASQAAYCAAKAGMDHFTRCVALEQALQPNGARLCSLAPGVIDTDMQGQLRGADAGSFPDRASFMGMKSKGLLSTPAQAAASVLAYLARSDFGVKPVADVRDA